MKVARFFASMVGVFLLVVLESVSTLNVAFADPPAPAGQVSPAAVDDSDWPIIYQSTTSGADTDGETIEITSIIRQDPNPPQVESPSGFCSFLMSQSHEWAIKKKVTQILKRYYYVFSYNKPNETGFAYWLYRYELSWLRPNMNWGLGNAHITTDFQGHDCDGNERFYWKDYQFIPQWQNETTTFIYNLTYTNSWVTLHPYDWGMETTLITERYKLGVPRGTIRSYVKWDH